MLSSTSDSCQRDRPPTLCRNQRGRSTSWGSPCPTSTAASLAATRSWSCEPVVLLSGGITDRDGRAPCPLAAMVPGVEDPTHVR
jgi:hypothetical protein